MKPTLSVYTTIIIRHMFANEDNTPVNMDNGTGVPNTSTVSTMRDTLSRYAVLITFSIKRTMNNGDIFLPFFAFICKSFPVLYDFQRL